LADPAALERFFPGLTAMSSAYSAARADTGLCRVHNRFRRSADTCADYEQKVPTVARS
jgi:hypothetical protein